MFFTHTKSTPKIALSFLVVVLCSCQTLNQSQEAKHKTPLSQPQVPEKKPLLLADSRSWLQPEWQKKVQRGDQARQQKQWNKAARWYNEALDLINDERATPQAPKAAKIQEIIRLASYSQLLADSAGKKSQGSCNTLMRARVRGVEIIQHLFPVEFLFNDTRFTSKGQSAAGQLARCLQDKGQKLSQITLIGHTDSRGDEQYNYKLSLQRAKALKSYLRTKGISLRVETEGRGETKPLGGLPPELTQKEIDQLNRRVEVKTFY